MYKFNFNSNRIISDGYIVDTNDLIFISVIGYKNVVKSFTKLLNEEVSAYLTCEDTTTKRTARVWTFCRNKYTVLQKKIPNTDYIHAICYLENYNSGNSISGYIYRNTNDEQDIQTFLEDKVFELFENYMPVPVLREWMPKIIEELRRDNSYYNFRIIKIDEQYNHTKDVEAYYISVNGEELKEHIQDWLKEEELNINGSNKESMYLDSCEGLNDYLDLFGESLAQKIQDNFKPKFTPGQDKYDLHAQIIDDFIHNQGIEKYEAQRAVEQAVANNWKINNNTLVVGECGAGKTTIASSACFIHHANMGKGFNTLVMCPSHIVEKWKREVESYVPNTKGYIVHNLTELLELKPILLNPYRTGNVFVILSKDMAKLSYDIRPAAIWRRIKPSIDDKHPTRYRKNVFVCPDCGEILRKDVKANGRKFSIPLDKTDFLTEHPYNLKCSKCGCKLWTTLNKDEEDCEWIKVGTSGWVMKQHIEDIEEELLNKDKLNKKEKNLLNDLLLQSRHLEEHNCYNDTSKKPKRYCITKYIKKYMHDVFTYGIQDEVHQLSSKSSIQGQTFLYAVQACKKNIGMTGTLINGYAESIYYILYRMFPSTMKKHGFNYEDINEFVEKYGVSSREYDASTNRNKKSKLPGISPLIFTDYLFNSTAFISLKDMKDELPTYTEVPVAVTMDEDVRAGYNEYETFLTNVVHNQYDEDGNKKSLKIIPTIIREMMDYCDCPHKARPIPDPDTEEIRFSPTKLEKETRNKDEELLRIVEQHVSNGERCLVYYNAVNKTDIGKSLVDLLSENGYVSYELKASVKSEKRESMIRGLIRDKGLDVLICNPKLVETGLDLIDFTTIIFYQVGYNLYTLRQASRRSWRLSQKNPVSVYYLYYGGTAQERALSLMATKLHAAKTVEGDFDEEGLKAMSENTDILTQIANNVVNGMECALNTALFTATNYVRTASNKVRPHVLKNKDIQYDLDDNGMKIIINQWDKYKTNNKLDNELVDNPLKLFI